MHISKIKFRLVKCIPNMLKTFVLANSVLNHNKLIYIVIRYPNK